MSKKPPQWKLLTIIFIEKYHLNGQPRKGKCTIMEIIKLTIKEDFRRGTVFSRFVITKSHYLITLISMYTLICVSWAASGSLLKFPLYDFNNYNDNWGRF